LDAEKCFGERILRMTFWESLGEIGFNEKGLCFHVWEVEEEVAVVAGFEYESSVDLKVAVDSGNFAN
jgi:hypothetical protein